MPRGQRGATIPALITKDGCAFADSRDVAANFGKRHDNVLRSIHELVGQGAYGFVWSTYLSVQNKETPHFLMDRDAFALLVMSFTGKKALQWKMTYIAAFNAMGAELRKLPVEQPSLTREQRIAMALIESQQVVEEQARVTYPDQRYMRYCIEIISLS